MADFERREPVSETGDSFTENNEGGRKSIWGPQYRDIPTPEEMEKIRKSVAGDKNSQYALPGAIVRETRTVIIGGIV